jgi:hypothetical protein
VRASCTARNRATSTSRCMRSSFGGRFFENATRHVLGIGHVVWPPSRSTFYGCGLSETFHSAYQSECGDHLPHVRHWVSVHCCRQAGHTPSVSKVFHSCPQVQNHLSSLRATSRSAGSGWAASPTRRVSPLQARDPRQISWCRSQRSLFSRG